VRAAIRWNLTCEGRWGPLHGSRRYLIFGRADNGPSHTNLSSGFWRRCYGRVRKSPKCLGLSPGARRSFASLRMTNFMGLDDRVVEKAGRTNASAPTWFVVIIAASSL